MNKQYIVGSPEGKIYSRMFRIYYIPLLKLLCLRVLKLKTMLNNRETDRKKSAQYMYKVKSRRHSENLLKKSYQFLKYAHAYLRKGRYAREKQK